MMIDRRDFLKLGSLSLLAAATPRLRAAYAQAPAKADYTIEIANGLAEIGPSQIISTTLYNGQFPGPLLRFKEGQPVTVDIVNKTDHPELLHWHGQKIPSDVDGAEEEGSRVVAPGTTLRETFTPAPRGFRFYHTHVRAGADLSRGQYSGLVGPVYIEPKENPGAYDQEIFLVLKEFGPTFSRGGDMDMDFLAGDEVKALKDKGEAAMNASIKAGTPKGYEVGYQFFTINGHMLGHGEPIRVKQGQRVLFHILNGSAGEIRSLAMPGHRFRVIALDGNPVPHPAEVPVLWIGTAERISAIVEMNHPGVFVLGDLSDDDRGHGMGIVVEYAGARGKPQWQKPRPFKWDYTLFGSSQAAAGARSCVRYGLRQGQRRRQRLQPLDHQRHGLSRHHGDGGADAAPDAGPPVSAAHAQRERRHPSHSSPSPQLRADADRRQGNRRRAQGCRHARRLPGGRD